MGMPRGSSHSAEAKEKIRAAARARWANPSFRAANLPNTLAMGSLGASASSAARKYLPPKGTETRKYFETIRRRIGTPAARRVWALARLMI